MIDLNNFAGGSMAEQFEDAFLKVLDNLTNPNTPYKDKRKITIDIIFAQNEERDDMDVSVLVKTKLASLIPTKTKFAIARDLKTGQLCAEEYGRGIKGQMQLKDYYQPENQKLDRLEEIDGKTVNTDTGEIIDYRKEK